MTDEERYLNHLGIRKGSPDLALLRLEILLRKHRGRNEAI
jgi:hypothetical protein